jgi:hypothetical protein
MNTRIELRITLNPETIEGGYTRYTTKEMPGFRVLCEPREDPIPLIEHAIHRFMPPWLNASAFRGRAAMRELRIIPTSPRDLVMGLPTPILMKAEIEHTTA